MRTNTAAVLSARTHEGAPSRTLKPIDELRRTASACLLFEDNFYESGVDVAKRIADLAVRAPLIDVLHLAQKLRHVDGLRHAPLWMLCAALEHPQRHTDDNGRKVSTVIANIAGSRGDLPGELLAMYWKNGKRPLAKALKRGLAEAVCSLSSYAIQKYAARGPIRLRDVLFYTHAKPRDELQAHWFKRLADDDAGEAGTWENRLSAGEDKRKAFTDLLASNEMGALAILRNLRNMQQAGIPADYVGEKLYDAASKVRYPILPFQFIAAARAVPQWEPMIERAMLAAVVKPSMPRLHGKTFVFVDRSGSMRHPLSTKSQLNRFDAACAMAILLREICVDVDVFDYGTDVVPVPPRRGFALADAIRRPNGNTLTGHAVAEVMQRYHNTTQQFPDRIIVVTDEQSRDRLPKIDGLIRGYVMNVAPYQNGIAWGNWTTISGFSENLVKFIAETEAEQDGV